MRVLFIMVGLPCSGKSTDIKRNELEDYTISSDELRVKFGAQYYDVDGCHIGMAVDKKVWATVDEMLISRFKQGATTILDSTGLYNLNPLLELCKKYRYRVVYVVKDTPIEVCIERNKNRKDNVIPEPVFYKFANRMKYFVEKYKDYETDIIQAFNKWGNYYYQADEFEKYENIYVIPDLHGSINAFENFVKDNDPFTHGNNGYIFLGDWIDRGEDSFGMISYMSSYSKLDNCYFLMGNHDIRLFDWAFDVDSHTDNEGFSRTLEKINKVLSKEELSFTKEYKKNLRLISKKFKDYLFFKYKGKDYFINHAGVDTMNAGLPSSYLIGKNTLGYSDCGDPYESYIDVGNNWADKYNIIQVFGHRNCFPNKLENEHKINDKAYCLECNIEYGSELKIMELRTKNIYSYYNPYSGCNGKRLSIGYVSGHALSEQIKIKDFPFCDLQSINFNRKVFYKKIWNDVTIRARGLYQYISDETIAGRGYNKFFNVDEMPSTDLRGWLLQSVGKIKVYEKYNGFLGLCFYNKSTDGLQFATKSMADGTKYNRWFRGLACFDELGNDTGMIGRLLESCRKNNVTYLFEVIHTNDDEHPIVYDKNRLVLLDVIENTKEGKLRYDLFDEWVFEKKRLEAVCNPKELDFKELVGILEDYIDNPEYDVEGFVLEDESGRHLKIKTLFYRVKKMLRTMAGNEKVSYKEKRLDSSLAFFIADKMREEGKYLNQWRKLTNEEFVDYYFQYDKVEKI